MITIPCGTRIDQECIRYAIASFMRNRAPILKKLDAYYNGESAVIHRARQAGAPNNMLTHPFARYIVTMAAGYLIGAPVTYVDSRQIPALDLLDTAYLAANTDAIDNELAEQASLYGLGVELIYLDERARFRVSTLSPTDAFVVYDDSAEHRPVMGISMRTCVNINTNNDRCEATVYTGSEIIETTGPTPYDLTITGLPRYHYFSGVPMIEYWNNARERGDVEPIISLIDAYDALQSDRVNDKQRFADSMLILTGVQSLTHDSECKIEPLSRALRENRIISLPDDTAKVEWLTKQLNETDAQVLASAIREDMHRLSMIPDMSDEQFAGNASGVAMRYKLMGFEQLTRVKERWFREGLRSRLRLASGVIALEGGETLCADDVQIIFSRSLPVNMLEEAQALVALRGLVPDELLLSQASFIDDAKAALNMRNDKLREQSKESVRGAIRGLMYD